MKIGDWVVQPTGKVDENNELIYTEPFQLTENTCYLGLKSWQPKDGEYCWMMSDKCEWPKLVKFTHMNNGYYCSGFAAFQKCEPFIGTLPSLLQD